MKRFIIPVLMLAACSTPKYTYNFSYHKEGNRVAMETQTPEATPFALDESRLTASIEEIVVPAEVTAVPVSENAVPVEITREQKKELKKFIKTELKAYKQEVKKADVKDAQGIEKQHAMDHDLKLAAIFGSVGLVALLIGGDVFFVIGGIALIIGVVFFVMWLSRQ